MICIRCESKDFLTKDAEIEQEFRDEILTVLTPVVECVMCGWRSVTMEQAGQLRHNTANEYRRRHHLLTSSSIKAMRIALEMSQEEFAKFVGVGSASIKRWETWLVQEKSSDELLRFKFQQMVPKA